MMVWSMLFINEDKTLLSHASKHEREVVSKSRSLKSELFIDHFFFSSSIDCSILSKL